MSETKGEALSISYARKYRPDSLEGYIGNEKVKETIKNTLKEGSVWPQTYLLTGDTGSGKTTLARILAREYRCENRAEADEACGYCDNCLDLTEFIKTGNTDNLQNVYEIDITDKSGKADVSELIDRMEYPAFDGSWSAFILDEAHLLTDAAASRLLKVFEEPNPNNLVILCTTNPEKMLGTLKNRAQAQYRIQKPKLTELVNHLAEICQIEGRKWDKEGLRMLATRSDFVIRNSLNYLEQVIKSRGIVTGESVAEEFNEVSDALIFEFVESYINKDILTYIATLYKVKTSYGFENFLQSLRAFLTRGTYVNSGILVEGLSPSEQETYAGLFSRFKLEELGYLISHIAYLDSKDAEMGLMYLILPQPSKESQVREFIAPPEGVTSEEKPVAKASSKEKAHRFQVKASREETQRKENVDRITEKTDIVDMSDVSDLFSFS